MTFKTGQFVHTTHAHPNNVYRIREVGSDWLHLDDNTTMGLSVDTESATLHPHCGNKYCSACTSVTQEKGQYVYRDRESGKIL